MKCGHKNRWENIKLFALDYIYCSQCGQKYDIPCPPQIKENLDGNMSLLLQRYGKVGIWGMTLGIMDLFRDSKIFQGPGIYPIDISESKRQMDLYGKKVHEPMVLNTHHIKVVVIAVPSHAGQILCQVRENHPGVEDIIDICRLIDAEPIINNKHSTSEVAR